MPGKLKIELTPEEAQDVAAALSHYANEMPYDTLVEYFEELSNRFYELSKGED